MSEYSIENIKYKSFYYPIRDDYQDKLQGRTSAFRTNHNMVVTEFEQISNQAYVIKANSILKDETIIPIIIFLFPLGFDIDEKQELIVDFKRSLRKKLEINLVLWKYKDNIYVTRPSF